MTTADINGDGKTDIVALSYSPDQIFWYENPTWKRRVVVEKHPRMPVAIQPLDVDSDGKVELILGAEYYEPPDTTKGGSIWLLKRPEDLDKPWMPIKLDQEPTLHRIRLLDKKDLVCSAILGREKKGAALFVLRRPADPFKDRWTREPISDELNTVHNTWSADWDKDGKDEVLVAAREGIVLFKLTTGGAWERRQIGKGYWKKGDDKRGSSEVAVGRLPGGGRYVAAVEPHHGHEAVIYIAPERPDQLWNRKLLIENAGGHTVLPADLTGTGVDSLLLGFVGHYNNKPGGPIVYIFHPLDSQGNKWDKIVLDNRGMPGEDGACSDLNADGRIDVIVAGHNKLKVFWNEGK